MHSHDSWLRFLTEHIGLRADLDINMIGYRIASGDNSVYEEYPEFACLRDKSARITRDSMRTVPDEILVGLLAPANEHYGLLTDYRVEMMLMDEVVSHMPDGPCGAIEIGCGAATYPLYLLSIGLLSSAVALDPSPTLMEQAKQIGEKLRVPIQLVQAYIQHWKRQDQQFDYVFSLDTLNWILGWENAARIIARLTRPDGGRCLIAYGYPAMRSNIPVDSMLRLLEEEGLEIVSAETAELIGTQPRVIIKSERH